MNQIEQKMVHQHSKFSRVFDERIRSLVDDHYCKRVDSRLPNVWLVRLKHMANGNQIVLKGYPLDGVIIQCTNGIENHREVVE